MVKGKVGVLVVDMQEAWLRDMSPKRSLFLSEFANFLKSVDSFGNDVDFWYLEYKGKGKTIPYLRLKDRYIPSRIFEKGFRSPFLFTRFDETLTREGFLELVVCGVCASRCVRETIEDGCTAGFNVLTSPDLVAKSPYSNVNYLERYQSAGARVFDSSSSILKYLSSK